MRTFKKQEVQAWLNAMSSDSTRPALCGVAFKDKALVMTDGYIMVALDIENEWQKKYEGDDWDDYIVPREKIKEWCKMHSAKAEITVEELFALATTDNGRFPEWRQLMPKEPKDDKLTQLLNMALVGAITQVFKNQQVNITMFGGAKPMLFEATEHKDIALVMPLVKGGRV